MISGNNRYGIEVGDSTTTGTLIQGNRIGTNAAGTASVPNTLAGVRIQNSSTNNTIGGTSASARNIISGNTGDGIEINGTSNNLVQGNYIGTDVTGAAGLANGGQGVRVHSAATNNTIGGTVAGAGNVISGNGGRGIEIRDLGTNGNVVQGNRIGTNVAGTLGIPNVVAGISVAFGPQNTTIGGTVANAGNLIAFNTGEGIHVVDIPSPALSTAILGNAIHSNGALDLDLNDDGVTANDPAPDADTGPNNLQNYPVLTAAMTNGLGTFVNFAGSLDSALSTTYRIEFFESATADRQGERYLGFINVTTNGSGTVTFGVTLGVNLAAGKFVTATATDPSNNTSEFSAPILAYSELVVTTTADTVDGTTTSVSALVGAPGADGRISLREAIQATNATAGLNTIRFGIPPAGTQTIVLGSALPTITSPVTIDGTSQPGWVNAPPYAPVIELNGTSGGGAGLRLEAGSDGSTIRGLAVNRCGSWAIVVKGSSNNVIAGNFLGTNLAGTAALANGTGITIGSAVLTSNNRVGGTVAADRNVISGNGVDGIQVSPWGAGNATANNVIEGNYIGTDVTGTVALGNFFQGIAVFTGGGGTNTSTVIGGTAPGAGNLISGNGGHGITVHEAGTTGTLVQGNKIGTNALGTAGIANGGDGVRIFDSASSNTVGGTAASARNLIAYNGGAGITVVDNTTVNNAILGNAIYSNTGLGIDLNPAGVTANDSGDGDSGPNDLSNFPLLTASHVSGANLTTYFQLDVPAGSYRIEFFRNPLGADGTGFGEGQVFAGTSNVTHSGGGALPFSHIFPGVAGDVITATTTRCTDGATCAAFGNTSEFSKALNVATTAVTLAVVQRGRAGPGGGSFVDHGLGAVESRVPPLPGGGCGRAIHADHAEPHSRPRIVSDGPELRLPRLGARERADVLLPARGRGDDGADGAARSRLRLSELRDEGRAFGFDLRRSVGGRSAGDRTGRWARAAGAPHARLRGGAHGRRTGAGVHPRLHERERGGRAAPPGAAGFPGGRFGKEGPADFGSGFG